MHEDWRVKYMSSLLKNQEMYEENHEEKPTPEPDSSTSSDTTATSTYHSWFGLDASINGKVSSDTEHTRQTDKSATYKVYAHAVQQPPAGGMDKVAALLGQAVEPVSSEEK